MLAVLSPLLPRRRLNLSYSSPSQPELRLVVPEVGTSCRCSFHHSIITLQSTSHLRTSRNIRARTSGTQLCHKPTCSRRICTCNWQGYCPIGRVRSCEKAPRARPRGQLPHLLREHAWRRWEHPHLVRDLCECRAQGVLHTMYASFTCYDWSMGLMH